MAGRSLANPRRSEAQRLRRAAPRTLRPPPPPANAECAAEDWPAAPVGGRRSWGGRLDLLPRQRQAGEFRAQRAIFPHRESAREEPAQAGGGCGAEARGGQEGWIARALSERPADRNRYPTPVGGPAPGALRRGASDRCSRAGMRVLRWDVPWMSNVPVTQRSAGATGQRGFERSELIWLVVWQARLRRTNGMRHDGHCAGAQPGLTNGQPPFALTSLVRPRRNHNDSLRGRDQP